MSKNLDALLQKASQTFVLIDKATCVAAWAQFRADNGGTGHPRLLGNPLDNVKIAKSIVPTWTLTLAAHRTSLAVNTCVKSTPQCRATCVMLTAGNAYFPDVLNGRRLRTLFAAEHPQEFLSLLTHEVRALEGRGTPFGLRLNVASDLRWEYIAPWLFTGDNVRAYDYTKWGYGERSPGMNGRNYVLTHSASEHWTDADVKMYTANGQNVAVVFDCHKHDVPKRHLGRKVIDGDLSDYRWDDPRGTRGVIVGLAAKGSAKTLQVGGFKRAV